LQFWPFMDFSIYRILYFFFIYSMLGWVLETVYVSVKERRFVNRGFLNGFYCPVYGFGMCGFILLFHSFFDRPVIIFLGGMLFASILEYFTGWILEKLFHARWWDYSNCRFNLNGRICLKFSFIWGALLLVTISFIHPLLERLELFFPPKTGKALVYTLGLIISADFFYSLYGASQLSNKLKTLLNMRSELAVLLEQSNLFEAVDDILTRIMRESFFRIKGKILNNIKSGPGQKSMDKFNKLQQAIESVTDKYNHLLNKIGQNKSRFLDAFPRLFMSRAFNIVNDIRDALKKKKTGNKGDINRA